MPRARRNLLEGGLYHGYNRFARNEEIFADEGEVLRLLDMICEAKRRDGFLLYAWCVMSNHFHPTLQTSAAPLS